MFIRLSDIDKVRIKVNSFTPNEIIEEKFEISILIIKAFVQIKNPQFSLIELRIFLLFHK